MTTFSYNLTDGNVTFTGTNTSDVINFGTGLDHRNFSFLCNGDDLLIYPDNGATITITNHFLSMTNRIESLVFTGATIPLDGNVSISTNFDNSFSGTNNDDVILGGNGNNAQIQGLNGDDVIYGGDGNDGLIGGSGNDTLYGGNGFDNLQGGDGNDVMYGGDGEDQLTGGNGDDIMYGGDNDDSFNDANGYNIVYAGDGDDAILMAGEAHGGNGNDYISGNGFAIGGYVDDVFYGDVGDDTIYGGDGEDTLWGGNGNDTLISFQESPTTSTYVASYELMYGEAGDDYLYLQWALSADLYGGTGNDWYRVITYPHATNTAVVIYDESGSNDTLQIGNYGNINFSRSGFDLVISNPYTVPGTTYNHYITIENHFKPAHTIENYKDENFSTEFSFVEKLTIGNDTYAATALTSPIGLDDNIVNALVGNDTVYLGIGGDIAYGGDGDDVLYGEAGDDYLFGENGNDILIGGEGNDIIDGGAGVNFINYAAAIAGVTVNLATGTATDDYGDTDTLININHVFGSAYNDTLTGDSGVNIFTPGAGNDIIDGGGGADGLDYAAATSAVTVNLATGTVNDGLGGTDTVTDIEDAAGSIYNDTLIGNSANNNFAGGYGDDLFIGGAGNDIFNGSYGTDTVSYADASSGVIVNLAAEIAADGDGGTDTVIAIENVIGSGYNDLLIGDGNANILTGGNGDDTLYGASGADELYGGGGSDTFVFEGENAFAAADIIADYQNGTGGDFIDISDVLSDSGFDALTDILSDWVTTSLSGTDTYLQIDRDGTGATYTMENVAQILNTQLSLGDLTADGNLITA